MLHLLHFCITLSHCVKSLLSLLHFSMCYGCELIVLHICLVCSISGWLNLPCYIFVSLLHFRMALAHCLKSLFSLVHFSKALGHCVKSLFGLLRFRMTLAHCAKSLFSLLHFSNTLAHCVKSFFKKKFVAFRDDFSSLHYSFFEEWNGLSFKSLQT